MRYRLVREALLVAFCAAGCSGNRSMPPEPQQLGAAATHTSIPVIELDAHSDGPIVDRDLYGASIAPWYDFLQRFVNPSLRKTGIDLVRFPGGSESDVYHWERGGSLCDSNKGYIAAHATLDNFMKHLAGPLGLDVAITLNYGSNRACNGGGEPSEAAAWAAHAKSRGYRVSYWTVGNEVYGSWEYDLHRRPHDPTTYSNAIRNGYYPAVKKADPKAKVGVVVDTPGGSHVRAIGEAQSLRARVRAYGFAEQNGYAFAIFNNTLTSIDVETRVRNAGKTTFTANLSVYGKAQYDKSKENHWVGPATKNLGRVGTSIPLTLPPYSISLLRLE
jgi:hypothetical protein